ncbi:arylesterase [Saccharospirillum sp. MSK14-1]|uniref:arylesterase n=1 Tax=Saccharospirillum sp. MSK14-1 TaxID=1897632 RepID=UPI000D34A33A|nr:arylesterase [Saccharospirillum sp. MSK14-1]PTY38661.1 arylesterase [Saccharospirillum sp. MSK14-1]
MSVTSLQSKWIVRSLLATVLILAILPTRAATLLVMGDSLSAGYGIDPQDGWVNLLAQRLDEQGASHQVINASISGETSRGGLDRLPALLEQHQPDLVLLELGANDGLRGYPVPRITTNLSRMIELSQRAGAEVILLGIQLPPNFGTRYTEPFFQQYAELADQFELRYLPFLLEGVALTDALMQDDGLHPTAAAQPQVLDNVWPLIAAALGELSS